MIHCEDKNCTIPIWGVSAAASGVFVLLVLILVLCICLCRFWKRVKKLKTWKDGTKLGDQPDVHYASLQNLVCAQVEATPPAPPTHRETDYASVAELQGLREEEAGQPGGEGAEGAGLLGGKTDPGDAAPEPQEGGGPSLSYKSVGESSPVPPPSCAP